MQRVRYLAGRPLPPSMRAWVLRDQTGPGNIRRYLVRGLLMFLPVYVVCAAIPGPALVRVQICLLLSIPVAYFQLALRDIYRRHLLSSNGIDPDVLKIQRLRKEQHAREEWTRRHPR
ncbi:hypothetical protein GCM10023147_36130 [Tsukamurella soli]|uniref:DUF5313 domain-containing protein n=1 Tax=Tsukamurella soli TaxID=644556 RepID=A0ABP8K149_9ACTN